MSSISETTPELVPQGMTPSGAAVEAGNEDAARDRLIHQVELILRQSGNTEPFAAATWVERWLQSPNHALGGSSPHLYLHTPEGEALLSSLIGSMAAGSYM